MPLRIAHVTNEPFGLQAANGVQHVVYCLARAQAQVGESVAVFSRDDCASPGPPCRLSFGPRQTVGGAAGSFVPTAEAMKA